MFALVSKLSMCNFILETVEGPPTHTPSLSYSPAVSPIEIQSFLKNSFICLIRFIFTDRCIKLKLYTQGYWY